MGWMGSGLGLLLVPDRQLAGGGNGLAGGGQGGIARSEGWGERGAQETGGVGEIGEGMGGGVGVHGGSGGGGGHGGSGGLFLQFAGLPLTLQFLIHRMAQELGPVEVHVLNRLVELARKLG